MDDNGITGRKFQQSNNIVSAMISRSKQARVKRRPALDTNLSRSTSKVLLSSGTATGNNEGNVTSAITVTGGAVTIQNESKPTMSQTANQIKEKELIPPVPV